MINMSKIYKTIDLFSGLGGIRKGYEMTGRFKNVLSAIPGVKSCSVSLEDKKADLVLTKDIDDSVFQDKMVKLNRKFPNY